MKRPGACLLCCSVFLLALFAQALAARSGSSANTITNDQAAAEQARRASMYAGMKTTSTRELDGEWEADTDKDDDLEDIHA